MDINQIINSILYIIPGFIVLSSYYFLIPTRKRSDFERLIASIIFSIPIYGLVLLVELLLKWDLKTHKALYIILSWPIAVILGWLLSKIIGYKWFNKIIALLGIKFKLKPTVWNEVFDLPEAKWVRTVLSSGNVYIGRLELYSLDPNDPDKDIFLHPAYLLKKQSDNEIKSTEFEIAEFIEKGVFIRGLNIVSVEFLPDIEIIPQNPAIIKND